MFRRLAFIGRFRVFVIAEMNHEVGATEAAVEFLDALDLGFIFVREDFPNGLFALHVHDEQAGAWLALDR